MLLGGSWCKELDGGNPLQDRSCLIHTARRALYSQSLLDIFLGTNYFDCMNEESESSQGRFLDNLIRLCEISYHRPREDTNGKTYPEQVITSVMSFETRFANYIIMIIFVGRGHSDIHVRIG